jgi:hypothetical protein
MCLVFVITNNQSSRCDFHAILNYYNFTIFQIETDPNIYHFLYDGIFLTVNVILVKRLSVRKQTYRSLGTAREADLLDPRTTQKFSMKPYLILRMSACKRSYNKLTYIKHGQFHKVPRYGSCTFMVTSFMVVRHEKYAFSLLGKRITY